MTATPAHLSDVIASGSRVALGDGIGSPRGHYGELSDAAAAAGDVQLLLGWTPLADPALRLDAFADVRALMSGWGLRRAIDNGQVHAPPAKLSALPSLLHGPLRPDVLLTAVVPLPGTGRYAFGTEVSWQRAAVDAGALVAGVICRDYPLADSGPPLPSDRVVIVGKSDAEPFTIFPTPPGPGHRELAQHIAAFVPDGARLQVGPGPLGAAVCDAIERPVRVECGLLPDGVLTLAERGLLIGDPIATYLAGGPALNAWADGRRLLHGIGYTHDVGRLAAGDPFVAVNMAIEIDEQGQANFEGSTGRNIGVVGGNPDFAAAGAASIGGLSIVALPTHHRGVPTLVEQLTGPVTVAAHDVDIVVTEHGAADLRGLDRIERAEAIHKLWPATP